MSVKFIVLSMWGGWILVWLSVLVPLWWTQRLSQSDSRNGPGGRFGRGTSLGHMTYIEIAIDGLWSQADRTRLGIGHQPNVNGEAVSSREAREAWKGA